MAATCYFRLHPFRKHGGPGRQARLFSRTVMATLAISLPILVALAAFGDPILKLWLRKSRQDLLDHDRPRFRHRLRAPGPPVFRLPDRHRSQPADGPDGRAGRHREPDREHHRHLWLGPIGPAIGSLPAVLVIDFTILPVIVCRHLRIPVRRYVGDTLLPRSSRRSPSPVVGPRRPRSVPAHAGASTLRDGVRGLWGMSVVVLAAWAVMAGVPSASSPRSTARS